ncbi:DNA recombination protein RmuC [Vibrio aphrogenes]|uniref:DNA recombination protein RmuC n=1 Tax=Vibrio aphrogenes TaxID=1891186 RepID=UPI000B35309E|nr:DNA recombination protein RmuC [Vibrio aphrogenes]
MQWIINHSELVWSFLIVIVILMGGAQFWIRSRYQHQLTLLQQQHTSELQRYSENIHQLQTQNQQLQQELDQLDIERDKSEFEARNNFGQLMAANERLKHFEQLQQERHQLQTRQEQLMADYHELQSQLREQQAKHDEEKRSNQEKLRLLEQAEQRLKVEFESLANQLFETKVKSVDEQNKQSLAGLLNPLKEQLQGFKQQVSDSYYAEAKERHTLVHEIKQLQRLNEQMAQDAVNLTQALKGDNKQQGNWGEVVLANVLQDSGLREGHEYQTQVSLNHESGKRYQPDVIVNLPEEKQVVVDSKMTLVAFERYFNAENDEQKAKALNDHLISVRNHIKQLSQKDYHRLNGITSLDYVLMFIPIEPAFQLAVERDPSLIRDAMEQNIIVVSPTTLLVALRTINNLWRNERQNQNAKLIAERASKLYDKMRLFIDDMEGIGQSLTRAQNAYQGAMNKLSTGRGNLIRQAESFKSLGVEVKKNIRHEITQNDLDNNRQAVEDKVN